MRQRIAWIAAALAFHCSFAVHAQHGYPSRPVRMVVTVPPGGAADFVARIMAQKLGDALGQTVVVDNRAGGGGPRTAPIGPKAPPHRFTPLPGAVPTPRLVPPPFSQGPPAPLEQ